MKAKQKVVLFLLVLSGIAGYLLSKTSFVGRTGITLFYKQYSFLKVWWQAGLLVFLVWMFLFFLHEWAQRKLSPVAVKRMQIATIAVALAGLFFTYRDFRHTLSHRWLGERFHLGGYLFWLGWIILAVFYLSKKSGPLTAAALPQEEVSGFK